MPLTPESAVYVPGHTAHRTINTGDMPLTYLGIYPARAGHDYGVIADDLPSELAGQVFDISQVVVSQWYLNSIEE